MGTNLGKLIRDYRKHRCIRQVDLADKIGASQGNIADLENGNIKKPRHGMLARIREALDIPEDEMMAAIMDDEKNAIAYAQEEGYWVAESSEQYISDYVMPQDNKDEPLLIKFIKKEAKKLTPEQEKEAVEYLKVILMKMKIDKEKEGGTDKQ